MNNLDLLTQPSVSEQIECWLASPQAKQTSTRRKPSLKNTTGREAGISSRTSQVRAFCALE